MAAPKRPTHVVTHKRRYLMVDGKMQHIPAGAQLTLTEKQAKGQERFITALAVKSIDLTEESK